jgi:uncharacterized protein DUF3237
MSVPKFNELPAALQTINTRQLFTVRFKVRGPINVGQAPGVDRRVGMITGGAFEGERLRGEVLEGSDWQTVRRDGGWTMDVRVLLKTHDGALISMLYSGLRLGPPEVLAALARGEAVDPASYYFRITATFETGSSDYVWLNRLLAVGTGNRYPDGPIYSVFEIV